MSTRLQPSDLRLRGMVVDELAWTPEVDSTRIGVAVVDGAVQLSGQVANYPEKNLAERAALRVRGVTCVAQEITVDGQSLFETDIDIAAHASRALASAVTVPADCVHALVEEQVITLSGTVRLGSQRAAADRAVRYLKGVVDVVNLITVHPAATAGEITDSIQSALLRDAELSGGRVGVTVLDGVVTLSGSVDSWPERRQADTAAWAATGVTNVVNQLVVKA